MPIDFNLRNPNKQQGGLWKGTVLGRKRRKRHHLPEGNSWQQVTTQAGNGTAPWGNPAGLGRSCSCLLLPRTVTKGCVPQDTAGLLGTVPAAAGERFWLWFTHSWLSSRQMGWSRGENNLIRFIAGMGSPGLGLMPTPNNATDTSIVWRGPTGHGGQGVIILLDPGARPQQGQASKSVRLQFPDRQHPPQSKQRARCSLGKSAGRWGVTLLCLSLHRGLAWQASVDKSRTNVFCFRNQTAKQAGLGVVWIEVCTCTGES